MNQLTWNWLCSYNYGHSFSSSALWSSVCALLSTATTAAVAAAAAPAAAVAGHIKCRRCRAHCRQANTFCHHSKRLSPLNSSLSLSLCLAGFQLAYRSFYTLPAMRAMPQNSLQLAYWTWQRRMWAHCLARIRNSLMPQIEAVPSASAQLNCDMYKCRCEAAALINVLTWGQTKGPRLINFYSEWERERKREREKGIRRQIHALHSHSCVTSVEAAVWIGPVLLGSHYNWDGNLSISFINLCLHVHFKAISQYFTRNAQILHAHEHKYAARQWSHLYALQQFALHYAYAAWPDRTKTQHR